MSAFVAAESLRWWCREWTVVLASMRRCTKILPAGMTFTAKASLPIKESRARFVHFCRGLKWVSSCRMAVSLACGRRAIWVMVLSSMPRNVMHVVGGMRFSALVCIHRCLHKASTPSKVVPHRGECGGPAMRKSSR